MCGIAGIYSFQGEVPEDALTRMGEALAHRGPDDQGAWISPDRRCGLVHRRLSILDTSQNGRQPMSNEDGTVWITYNGEVYNSPALREELLRRDHRFRSRTDTEAIVHAFEDEGIDCVRRLDGMFAFGIYDQGQKTLHLARDRLGIKPLYYYADSRFLVFASEIKALLQHPDVPRDLDIEALGQYLSFRTTVPPRTIFRGVRKLRAATTLRCGPDGVEGPAEYWDPFSASHAAVDPADIRGAAARVRELLSDSVRKMLLSDVPLGAFLSGGLDSSAIVGLMAEHTDAQIDTFTVRWQDHEEYNEGHFPQLVSDRFRTKNHEVVLDHRALLGYLKEMVYAQDEPLADVVSMPLHYLSDAVRRHGTKVVLVGGGSGEIFLGYDSRIQAIEHYERTWRRLFQLPLPLRRGLHLGASLVSQLSDSALGLSEKLKRLADEEELFYGSVAFSDARKQRLLTPEAQNQMGDAQALLKAYAAGLSDRKPEADFVDKVMNLDIKLRLGELLLPRVDRMTMASGIEARVPFLDHQLVEYAVRTPTAHKIVGGQGKHVLKLALADLLPEEVLRRPKKPFGVPMAPWLRGELTEFARQTILGSRLRQRGLFDYRFIEETLAAHQAGTAQREVEIWTLLTVSAWYDRWM